MEVEYLLETPSEEAFTVIREAKPMERYREALIIRAIAANAIAIALKTEIATAPAQNAIIDFYAKNREV